MGHILLLILKILGILILVIIGLLVFLIASVLFVPVRYSFTGKKTESETTVKLRFHWFLHILSFYGCYENETFSTRFRIFGIPLSNKKGTNKNDEHEEEASQADSSTPLNTTATKEDGTEPSQSTEKEATSHPHATNFEQSVDSTGNENKKQKQHKKATGWIESCKKQWTNLKRFFKKLWTTLQRAWASTHSFLEFIQADATKQAFRFVKQELQYLFKHIKPRKVKGELIIGFEDPSVTGQCLAVSSMLYPLLGEKIKLYPDFENEVLEGHIQIRGHIRVIHGLLIALHVFRNKNIMQIIKKFQNKN